MNDNEYIRKDIYEANRDADRKLSDERVKNLEARIDDYKTATSQQNTHLGLLIGGIAAVFALMQIGMGIVLWILSQPVK